MGRVTHDPDWNYRWHSVDDDSDDDDHLPMSKKCTEEQADRLITALEYKRDRYKVYEVLRAGTPDPERAVILTKYRVAT